MLYTVVRENPFICGNSDRSSRASRSGTLLPRLVRLPARNGPPYVPLPLDHGGVDDALRPLLSLAYEAFQGRECSCVVAGKDRFEPGHDSALVGGTDAPSPSSRDHRDNGD